MIITKNDKYASGKFYKKYSKYMNIAIVIITYNRPQSLKRLLSSIENAAYCDENIPLIISIDYQESVSHKEVVKVVNDFNWKFGEKIIIEHQQNLGLREHVITCGNLSENYDGIIMLEDDLFVSPYFYNYAEQLLFAHKDSGFIGGISLYNYEINYQLTRPFHPTKNQYDIYYLQHAQSWGQAWSKGMWSDFFKWYQNNKEWDTMDLNIPKYVLNWPNSSWLKYFVKYLIVKNKYFAYPYISLTSNFQDAGTHIKSNSNICQVALNIYNIIYKIPSLNEAIIYDVFFERTDKAFFDSLPVTEVLIDLYGSKVNNENKRYWLSTKLLPYKIIKSYGLNLRPHEMNIILNNAGQDIFLFDTFQSDKIIKKKNILLTIFNYDYYIPALKLLRYLKLKIKYFILDKIKC